MIYEMSHPLINSLCKIKDTRKRQINKIQINFDHQQLLLDIKGQLQHKLSTLQTKTDGYS